MRFMVIRKADADTEAGMMPTEELIAAMARYHEEMVSAGVLIAGDGLKPSAKGARVKFDGGRPSVIDGPFAETKELVAGYSILELGSLDEAVEWVKRWPAIDGGGNVEIEIRPLYELSDFGEGEELDRLAEVLDRMPGR